MSSDSDTAAAIKAEFLLYKHASAESLRSPEALRAVGQMDVHLWWSAHGHDTAHLKLFAMRLTGQVASASACERSWSTFDFIQSKRRNRLTPKRASDLVYVFSNKRVLRTLNAGRVNMIWDRVVEPPELGDEEDTTTDRSLLEEGMQSAAWKGLIGARAVWAAQQARLARA
jgi:hypothetical protein